MPEMNVMTIVAIVAILGSILYMARNSIDFSSILSRFSTSKTAKIEGRTDFSTVEQLWKLRENFTPDDPVYKNLTEAIENLIHQNDRKNPGVIINE